MSVGAPTWQVWQTRMCTSIDSSATSFTATFLFIWVCRAASSSNHMSSMFWEREKCPYRIVSCHSLLKMPIFMCNTGFKRMRSWPTERRHHGKPWAEREKCAPVNIPERGWHQHSGKKRNSVKKKAHKTFIVYCYVHVHVLAVTKTGWLCYANWTR